MSKSSIFEDQISQILLNVILFFAINCCLRKSLAYKYMLQNKVIKQYPRPSLHRRGLMTAQQKETSLQQIKKRMAEVKIRIDDLIEKDFQFLKTHQAERNLHRQLKINQNDDLVRQYVRNNYEEYQLKNPLPDVQYSRQSINRQSNKRSQKIFLYSAAKRKTQLDQSHKKFQSHKKADFKIQLNQQDFNGLSPKTKIHSQEFSNYEQKTKKAVVHLRKNTKITLPYLLTQQKNYQSYHKIAPSQFQMRINESQLHSQRLIQSHYIHEGVSFGNIENKESLVTSIKNQKTQNSFQKIQISRQNQRQFSERFRYCLGCERALLQINIDFHEKVCADLKHAYSLKLQQLQCYVGEKVAKFEKQLLNVNQWTRDEIQIEELCKELAQASSQIRKTGKRTQKFVNAYNNIVDSCRVMLEYTEKLSRLNWFLQIYQNIRKKRTI